MPREPKIVGYRVAVVRPYGPRGDELEVTPVGDSYDDQAQAEIAATKVEHAHVIELYRGGRTSADPPGRPLSNQWRMVCTAQNWELPHPTWDRAARTTDRIARHQECRNQHRIVTRWPHVIAAFVMLPSATDRETTSSSIPCPQPT